MTDALDRFRPARLALALLLALYGAMVAHAVFHVGGAGLDDLFVKWIYNGVLLGSSASCVARALLLRRERLAWFLLGAALLLWAAGNIYFTIALFDVEQIPIPSWSDAGWLAIYPLAYLALVLLLRSRVSDFRASLWLDGLIGALAVLAVGAAVVLHVVLGAIGGDAVSVAIAIAYPLLDLLLVALVVWALAVTGWKPGGTFAFLAGGFALFGIADSIYVHQVTVGTYTPGSIFDMGWPGATVLLAFAAWQPTASATSARLGGWRALVMPVAFALTGLGVLVYGTLRTLEPLAVGLASATLVVVIVRMGMAFRENMRMLERSRREAVTDSLTGLANRRRLIDDLGERLTGGIEDEPLVLVLLDLDGFKAYNDSFGHPAGDALLTRLARSLAAELPSQARAYRMGGDEFCVLAPLLLAGADELAATAAAALREQGEGFDVGCSYGFVRLPEEARTPSEALRIADNRMYGQKDRRRLSAGEQTIAVLVRAVDERDAALSGHHTSVARLAYAVGQKLGLAADDLHRLRQAASLHDVGKLAIPETILDKPGQLTEDEWDFVRRHPVIGERIVSAAPALAAVARLVRASHERIDGHGYPDGLAGAEIPLGARIILVCDAFDAMTSARPHSPAMTTDDAFAELERCAGTQFDPAVVAALSAAYADLPARLVA